MSVKTSLKFPKCHLELDTIALISVEYDGPSLVGATVRLTFSNGDAFTSADVNEIELIQGIDAEHWTIEVKTFAPSSSGDLKYDFDITYADGSRVTVYKGTFKVSERVKNG